MLVTLLTIFVLLIFIVIYIEYKNEKKYKAEKKKRKHKNTKSYTRQDNKLQTPKKIQPNPKKSSVSKPQTKHPKFTHSRLVDMGFSNDEAKEFVAELIPQIEMQIPLIKEAIDRSDFHQTERLTHHIKGSSTNIGTGGVSDLLVEYNTYLKRGTDISIAEGYLQDLIHYTHELKLQYT